MLLSKYDIPYYIPTPLSLKASLRLPKQDHSQCSKYFKTNFTGQQGYFYYKNKYFISCDYPDF